MLHRRQGSPLVRFSPEPVFDNINEDDISLKETLRKKRFWYIADRGQFRQEVLYTRLGININIYLYNVRNEVNDPFYC